MSDRNLSLGASFAIAREIVTRFAAPDLPDAERERLFRDVLEVVRKEMTKVLEARRREDRRVGRE